MAHADVLVLRSSRSREKASSADDASPGDAWPTDWLPEVLAQRQEEETVDGVVHRYRGARLLYTSGCRRLQVTAAPSDPRSLRLTVVWRRGASNEERAAVMAWWSAASADRGWRPGDEDDVVGGVVVEEYEPSERTPDEGSEDGAVLHDWERVDDGSASRTSGRRT
jgi:hypothetical protein